MYFKRNILQQSILMLSDVFSMGIAFLCSIAVTQLYHADLSHSPWFMFFHFGYSKFLGLVVLAVFWYQEQYTKRRPFWEELLQIMQTISLFVLINLGIAFVLGKGSLKVMLVGFWLSFAILAPLARVVVKLTLTKVGVWQRDLYILGSGLTAFSAYQLFAHNVLMGYNLKAFVGEPANAPNELPVAVISEAELIKRLEYTTECDIIVGLEHGELSKKIGLINFLQHKCLSVLVVPEISGLALYGAQIEHFFGNDQLVLRLNNNLARMSNALVKRVFDLCAVIIGLVLLSPVFLIIALLIKFGAKTNVFYCHSRVGKAGKAFYCIKFQTMYANSAELLEDLLTNNHEARMEWEQGFKLKNDPRVTPIGRWLRKTSLDELPQLFNVLIGNMSLVGPRPIVDKEIERYQQGFYYYQLVLPGVTGLWQVSGRSNTDYVDRVRLDEWYVKNWSLWYDIVILIKTVRVVLSRSGAY